MTKVILGYWAIRGLGERIRLLMQYLHFPYDQQQFHQDKREEWFEKRKPQLMKKNPAITLPYLIDGEEIITQSDAIITHIIYKSGRDELLGKNPKERTQIATVMGIMRDFHRHYVDLCYGRTEKKVFEEAKVQYTQKFRVFLTKLTGLLGGNHYFCPDITYVDFVVADLVQIILHLLIPQLEKDYKQLSNHQKRIWGLTAIDKYIHSNRFHQRPANGTNAKWT